MFDWIKKKITSVFHWVKSVFDWVVSVLYKTQRTPVVHSEQNVEPEQTINPLVKQEPVFAIDSAIQNKKWQDLENLLATQKIVSLDLTSFSNDIETFDIIISTVATVLKRAGSILTNIGLNLDSITDANLIKLTNALKSKECKVKHFSLCGSRLYISDDGITAISNALQCDDCKITHLTLDGMNVNRAMKIIEAAEVKNKLNYINFDRYFTTAEVFVGPNGYIYPGYSLDELKKCFLQIVNNSKSSINTFIMLPNFDSYGITSHFIKFVEESNSKFIKSQKEILPLFVASKRNSAKTEGAKTEALPLDLLRSLAAFVGARRTISFC